MNRPTPRFQPRLEDLEERCTPSTLAPPSVDPVAALVATDSETHSVPFQLTGGGPAPGGMPLFPGGTAAHSDSGHATHLGSYTGEGTFELGSLAISPTGAVTGTFQGSYVFVAANGDQLAFTYGDGFTGVLTGQLSADGLSVTNVTFEGEFTLDPANCTGRFAKYTSGSFHMVATADSISLVSSVPGFTAPFDYSWDGDGSLQFKTRKR
jgi:hypothetical protein